MWTSETIRDWYRQRLGRRVMALLVDEILRLPDVAWQGAAKPELLVSAGRGVGGLDLATPWPTARVVNGLNEAGEECRYDRIILLHEIEFASDPDALLKGCYKLLRPDGRMIVMVANRTSPWAMRDVFSPFGGGKTYSMGQVTALLKEANLSAVERVHGLFVPPVKTSWIWRWAWLWGWLFRRRLPWFGGVLLVVARKDVAGVKAMKVAKDGAVTLQAAGVPVVN